MFYCQRFNSLSKAGEKACKLVTKVRLVTYRRGDKIVGNGWEIATEILVSRETYDNAKASGFKPESEKAVERFLPFIKKEDRIARH